jgi:hypothetical protein
MLHLFKFFIELPSTLLYSLPESRLLLSVVILIEVSFFQLTILVLEILDLLLHHLDGDIFGLQFLFDEDVIDFVSLLNNY